MYVLDFKVDNSQFELSDEGFVWQRDVKQSLWGLRSGVHHFAGNNSRGEAIFDIWVHVKKVNPRTQFCNLQKKKYKYCTIIGDTYTLYIQTNMQVYSFSKKKK